MRILLNKIVLLFILLVYLTPFFSFFHKEPTSSRKIASEEGYPTVSIMEPGQDVADMSLPDSDIEAIREIHASDDPNMVERDDGSRQNSRFSSWGAS